MKKKFLFFTGLIFLSLASVKLYAQNNVSDTPKTHSELNIIIDDIFAKPPVIDPSTYDYSTSGIQYIPKVGIGYKLNFSRSALRTKLSIGSSQNSSDKLISDSKSDNSSVSMQYNVGYEWQKNMNKLQIFYGLDLFVSHNAITAKSVNANNSRIYRSEDSYKLTGFGASPFLGFEYFVIPHLSISTEINFTVESYKGESKNKSSYQDNITRYDLKGINTRIGPIGNIGFNLHF